jgi:hypothetical protein
MRVAMMVERDRRVEKVVVGERIDTPAEPEAERKRLGLPDPIEKR